MPRPKGSPNINKRELKARLKQLLGDKFDPVLRMAESALRLSAIAEEKCEEPELQKMAIDGWDKVAQYVEPKLKAIEVKGELAFPQVITKDLSGQ